MYCRQLQSRESRQPLSGQRHRQDTRDLAVVGIELDSDKFAELCAVLARHAHLEEIRTALLGHVHHFVASTNVRKQRREALAPNGMYNKKYKNQEDGVTDP